MTEWLLIIIMGAYVVTPNGLTQTGSDVKFMTFSDHRSCDSVRRVLENKMVRTVECVEITKEIK